MTPKPLPLDLTASALPEEVAMIVNLLIEGRLTDLVVIARTADGTYIDGMFPALDGHDSDTYGMLGALTATARDWMRAFVQGRVEYVETAHDDDEEDL